MDAYAYPFIGSREESLRGTLLLSIILHIAFFASVGLYAVVGLRRGPGWGTNWKLGSAVHVNAVSALPQAMPLPAPPVTTPNSVAVENPGVYQTKTEPKPKPQPQAELIPKFKQALKPERPLRANKRIQKLPVIPPPNAVPFGQGGNPAMNYSPIVTPGGQGGLAFGQGNFGDRFGWYVDAVRSRISGNWLTSTISPSIASAPRVFVDFDIERDGTIANARVAQSSGIPEVDRAALRAVLASNPLGPLPPDYSGGKVSVEFYFDFRR